MQTDTPNTSRAMDSDAQELFDLLLGRIRQAHDIATLIAAIATALRDLLGALATQHLAVSQDVAIAEGLARKAMELWDQFWSIEVSSLDE